MIIWAFAGFSALLVVTAFLTRSPPALVVLVVVAGLLQGVLNTVVTESVMEASDLPRSVASSAYSSVRFVGGAIAAPLSAFLAHLAGAWLPYTVGAASVAASAIIVGSSRKQLSRIDRRIADAAEEAEAIGVGDVD